MIEKIARLTRITRNVVEDVQFLNGVCAWLVGWNAIITGLLIYLLFFAPSLEKELSIDLKDYETKEKIELELVELPPLEPIK